ncbi:MAG TPA: peptidylprolyl isomerase, partial [Polyangiaceae bacterium]
MLRQLRSGGFAKLVFAAVAVMIILVFALEFRPGSRGLGGLTQPCVVELGSTCLDQKDYFAAYGIIVPRGADPQFVRRNELRKKVLEGLVERELLVAQARKLGLGVSNDAIESELQEGRAYVSIPAADGRGLSAALLLCRSEESGGCAPGTQDMVRQIRVRRTPDGPFDYELYQREIRILANRGPREFKEMQEREQLAARLRNLVRSRVRVSEEEARFLAERAVVRSAVVSRDWFAKYIVDTDEEAVARWAFENRAQIDSAWESEKANWVEGCPLVREMVFPVGGLTFDDAKDPALLSAKEARSRVAAGEDFGLVARQASAAPSALLGGRVGCLSKNSGPHAEQLAKAVESLEPGKLSEPIETPQGYYVLELQGRLAAADAEKKGREQIALGLYTRFAADEAARSFADRLIEAVKGGQKLEDAVNALTSELVEKAGPKRAAPGPGAKSSENPWLVAARSAPERPRFEVSPPFNRSSNPLPDVEPLEAIAPKAFELNKADSLYEKPIETRTGFVVFQLKEIEKMDADDKGLQNVKEALLEAKADHALARYVADLRRQAG